MKRQAYHNCNIGVVNLSFPNWIQICPKQSGISPNQSYDLGMGCFDHQSYSIGRGIWILRVCLKTATWRWAVASWSFASSASTEC